MTAIVVQFLIICPLCLLAGFVDAIVGGGGLISLPAYLMAGLPAHLAIGTNRINSAMGSTVAAVQYAKDGYVPWKKAIICLASALVGAFIGAKLALLMNEQYFLYLMLVILPVTGLFVFFNRLIVPDEEKKTGMIYTILAIVFCFVIGAYDGFYGPGSGTFLLLLMTMVAHMSMKEANGISKLIFMVTNLTAFFVFLNEGKMMLLLGLVAGVFSMVGNYLGARYFKKANERVLKGLILCVLTIFMIRVIFTLVHT